MKPCCEIAAMFQVTCLDHKPVKAAKPKAKRTPNLCAKTVKRENAYEVWTTAPGVPVHGDGSWTWFVLKKWQVDDDAPNARWFCNVVTPMVGERGETGDVYVSEIKRNARRIK
jgi:hypothetical protein